MTTYGACYRKALVVFERLGDEHSARLVRSSIERLAALRGAHWGARLD
jgi:hypothetical protein